ncbi:hypothetical protein [Paracoccus methylarcula]|uniref:Uracil-DNA glycosylase-like domain-containing protein n=1 Tax=Paracoccus methylarcula TaxID=72022 RepID=A0A422QVN7_9RHOB|nr:hypothetical protein [Paracoccus methylarcula]RNF34012.1 hypothetical protein A7A09_014005 [Paracoccus methylarcula]
MLTEKMMDQLERHIRGWTRAINGQFPRPWMTDSPEPHKAEVFIVGRNQKHGYEVSKVGSQERHINALFNRNGETCRGIYDEIAPMPSRTRMNTDALTRRLRSRGIEHILETNVICYSSPMSGDLSKSEHVGGKAHGMEVFRGLLDLIRPKVLIAHGSGTLKDLARTLGESRFEMPDSLKR